MQPITTPRFSRASIADFQAIDEAVTQWPEEWQYRFHERAGLLRFSSGWVAITAERGAFEECSALAAAEGLSLAELRIPGRQ